MVFARTAPARSSTASKTSSAPMRAAVWETAARALSTSRPDLMTTTGFRRAAARSALMNPRVCWVPST